MSEKLEQLKSLLAEVADLNATQALLNWDQQTYMPQGGNDARSNQLATIGKISHQKFTSDEIGILLAAIILVLVQAMLITLLLLQIRKWWNEKHSGRITVSG